MSILVSPHPSRWEVARRSQSGATLLETLVALAIAVIVLAPVGGWMILVLTSQATTAAGFTDAGQSRLLNTYVTRDVTSAEILYAGVSAGVPPGRALVDCKGASGASPTPVLNAYQIGTADGLVSYTVVTNPDGGHSLMRRTCDLATLSLRDDTEVVRDLQPPPGDITSMATCNTAVDCKRVTVSVTLPTGRTTSASATRRGTAAALAGQVIGQYRPVAVITQGDRNERTGSGPLQVGLSGEDSWDLDTPSADLQFTWTVTDGPAGASFVPTTGRTTIFSAAAAGSYTVVLTVTDPNGNRSTATLSIPLVNRPPEVTLANCALGTFDCTAQASDPDGPAVTYKWTFPADQTGGTIVRSGDTVSGLAVPTGLTGSVVVLMEVTDSEGAKTTVPISVNLGAPSGGAIDITPQLVTTPGLTSRLGGDTSSDLPATFAAKAGTNGATGWELLQGTTVIDSATFAGAPTPLLHTFARGSSGEFTIRLLMGAGTPVDTRFRVNSPPIASFKSPTVGGNAPQTLAFTDTSSDDWGLASWAWTFDTMFPGGDHWPAGGQNPTWNFTKPGTYVVRLTVIDRDGSSASTTATLTVPGVPGQPWPPPLWSGADATFSPVHGATGYKVRFTYRGTQADGVTGCTKTVDVSIPAGGPFKATDNGNTCPIPSTAAGSTGAQFAVVANAATGPFSLESPR